MKAVPVKVELTRVIHPNGDYQLQDFYGTGHTGPAPLERIIMSLKSGIESEVDYALKELTTYSFTDPKLVNFDSVPFLGQELIAHFAKPYKLILDGKLNVLTPSVVSLSVEAITTLRNAAQDLPNQQWLSQLKHFKKYLVEALKILIGWFYPAAPKAVPYFVHQNSDLFRESLNRVTDLIDPLSCYYIDNTKHDPLFNALLSISTDVRDKSLFTSVIKSLGHLLFTRDPQPEELKNEEEEAPVPNNCIDLITTKHLETFVNLLYVDDKELVQAVLEFLNLYLTSSSLHPLYPTSVKNSQLHRLRKLVQGETARANLHTLLKQLPLLVVSELPLLDPQALPPLPSVGLSRRSAYTGIPSALPKLSQQLYDIIIKFPEPLRATTWLRCCYEPYYASDEAVGEVTQISLWKSYETQFEEVWQTSKLRPNPEWPNLLPAVDFIKNVSSAFPNSEAMVVNMEVPEGQPPKKKFIIKGIQPRQFAVSIDVGNFEALRQKQSFADADFSQSSLPAGHVDSDKFASNLAAFADEIVANEFPPVSADVTSTSSISRDILGYIIAELLEQDVEGEYKNVFRHYNAGWLQELIFANPGLVEKGYFESLWLLYLL